MEGSNFAYDHINFLDIKFNQVDLIRGGTYIKEDKWLANKKATINPKNNKGDDVYCFMYAITVALNHNKIDNHPERILNIIPHIPKYNRNRINFPSQRKDWELFEKDNEDIALNILSIPHNKKTIELQYKSKYNRTRKNQAVLLMITDGKKWHYLALKSMPANDGYMRPTQSISRLFNKITSNHNDDYYCLNCFHSYRTEDRLKKRELICNNHNYCEIVMPDDKNKILKYIPKSKSLKMAQAIYVDIECLLVKHDTCSSNLNRSWSKTVSTHIPSGYSINAVNEYKDNYHTYYRGIDCMNKLSKDLLKIGKKIINEEKKDTIPLTDDQKIKQEKSTHRYLCNQSFNTNKQSKYYKNYKKVRDHCNYTGIYRGAAHYLCNLKNQVQKDIPVIIHNGSNYDFHLLIKDLANEFKSDIYCLGENTEKYVSFSVKIVKNR